MKLAKKDQKEGKDPIKDKYNVKVGFFKKIHLKYLSIKTSISKNKGIKEDSVALIGMLVSIVTYGVLGSLALSLFGFGIGFLQIAGIGSLLWLIDNKFTPIITKILSSIQIVRINN